MKLTYTKIVALLPDWYEKILTIKHDSTRDAILFVLLTGVPWSKVVSLTWDRVDLENSQFYIDDLALPIDGRDRGVRIDEIILPISSIVLHLVQRRRTKQKSTGSQFVFEGRTGQQLGNNLRSLREATPEFKWSVRDVRFLFNTVAAKLGFDTQKLWDKSCSLEFKQELQEATANKIFKLAKADFRIDPLFQKRAELSMRSSYVDHRDLPFTPLEWQTLLEKTMSINC